MPPSLRGKVAIVVGAGSAVGRATALMLAQRDAAVFCVDPSAPSALQTADLARQSAPSGHSRAEPGKLADLRRAFAECRRTLGQPDIVVNCAGAAPRSAWPGEHPDVAFHEVVEANLRSAVLSTGLALSEMSSRGGSVVNVSFLGAPRGLPFDPVFAAAAAGVQAFTRSLAYLHQQGIRVMCVAAGPVDAPSSGPEPEGWREYLQAAPRTQPTSVAFAVCELVRVGKSGTVKELQPRD